MARRQGIITLVPLALTSDFTISDQQRRRTQRTDVKPWLNFNIKPYGCRPGATYVLRWSKPDKLLCGDGAVIQIPRQPLWWLTVTAVQRHRKGFWRVRYDTTNRRDPTLFLKAGGGYTTSRWSAINELAVPRRPHPPAAAQRHKPQPPARQGRRTTPPPLPSQTPPHQTRPFRPLAGVIMGAGRVGCAPAAGSDRDCGTPFDR